MIYLDYSATTPISDAALNAYTKVASEYFGNSSSLHDYGSAAKQILEASAKAIAGTVNARPKDIFFTSGATESTYLGIKSLIKAAPPEKTQIISSPIEHSSVKDVMALLAEEGYEIRLTELNETGRIDPSSVEKLITDKTALVSIQWVNSEIGTIQPIAEIGELLHKHSILFHSDIVQAYGKRSLDVQKVKLDAFSVSAHKIYGPKGCGACWINPEADWKAVVPGTSGDTGFKKGTKDVSSIAAFATAAKEIHERMAEDQNATQNFKQLFVEELNKLPFEVNIEGDPDHVLENILGIRFTGIEGQYLMLECNQSGLAISTGSACQVGSEKPNATMLALGRDEQQAREFVRFSFGRGNSPEQIPMIIDKLNTILSRHFKKTKQYQ